MFTDFPVLYVDVIVRRTIVACVALAVVALAAGVLLDQPLAGVGVVLGLAGATVNHRFFQISTRATATPTVISTASPMPVAWRPGLAP